MLLRPHHPFSWRCDDGIGVVFVVVVVQALSQVPTLFDPLDYSPAVPLSMGLPRQEYWSGLPFPSLGGSS